MKFSYMPWAVRICWLRSSKVSRVFAARLARGWSTGDDTRRRNVSWVNGRGRERRDARQGDVFCRSADSADLVQGEHPE